MSGVERGLRGAPWAKGCRSVHRRATCCRTTRAATRTGRTSSRSATSGTARRSPSAARSSASRTCRPARRVTLTKVAVDDRSGIAFLVFFNQWFLKKQFDKLRGQKVVAYGKASRSGRGGLDMTEVEWEALEEDKDALSARPHRAGLPADRRRPAGRGCAGPSATCLEEYGDLVEETLPPRFCESAELCRRWQTRCARSTSRTARSSAWPPSAGSSLTSSSACSSCWPSASARRTRRAARSSPTRTGRSRNCKSVLPYPLTGAQARVIGESPPTCARDKAMNRLVQGDVGAGKTVVAMAALLVAVRNGYQAALMAPTEILAEQHYLGIRRTMETLGVTVSLLSGSLPAKEKRAALAVGRVRRDAHRGRHPRADSGRRGVPPAGPGRRGRAAPLRRHAARGPQAERLRAGRAGDDGDADPAHADADGLRRPGREHH